MWRNNDKRFGLVSVLMHWLVAVAVLGLFALGWYMVELTYYDLLYNTLPHIHKSVGMLLIAVFAFRIGWSWINPKPRPLSEVRWQRIAANAAHHSMNLLIGLILLTGYLIPTAEGRGIEVFDWFEVPATITSLPRQEDLSGLLHEYMSYLLIGLVLVHALAALKHHFINRDNSLRRILGLSERPRKSVDTSPRHQGVET